MEDKRPLEPVVRTLIDRLTDICSSDMPKRLDREMTQNDFKYVVFTVEVIREIIDTLKDAMLKGYDREFWIRAQHVDGESPRTLGIYYTRQMAEESCRTDSEFIYPVMVARTIPLDPLTMVGAYFPLRSGKGIPI